MHERGGLEGLARIFGSHLRRREFAQLLIHERQQLVRRAGVAIGGSIQNPSNVFPFAAGISEMPLLCFWKATWPMRRRIRPSFSPLR
jgi:hypothetical protein